MFFDFYLDGSSTDGIFTKKENNPAKMPVPTTTFIDSILEKYKFRMKIKFAFKVKKMEIPFVNIMKSVGAKVTVRFSG